MAGYDGTLGALLLASWTNSVLMTIEGRQIFHYYSRFRHDTLFNKLCVLLALCNDLTGMVAILASIYLYTITNFGDSVFASTQPWSMPLYVITSGVSGAITQTFLSLRLYRLTGYIVYPIVFAILSCSSLAGALGTAVQVFMDNSLAARAKLTNMVILWLSCAAAVDILIALSLIFTLIRTKTVFRETGSLLRRLMVSAVKTGSVTAGGALICLILFIQSPALNIHVFFSMALGRLYTISMLSNLNARNSTSNDGVHHSSGDGGKSRSRSELNMTEMKGVKVTSHTVTHVDRFVVDEERGFGISDVNGKNDFDSDRRNSENPSATSVSEAAVPYKNSNHRDEWDDRSLEHSQVDLIVDDSSTGNAGGRY